MSEDSLGQDQEKSTLEPVPVGEGPARAKFRIWAAHCSFRKDGSPVLGNMGSSVRKVIVFEGETWKRLCAEIPQLAATQFEVGTFE